MPDAIIEARGVKKIYTQPGGSTIEVIAATDLAIYPGTIITLLGPSGSGKSTLLRILSGLAPPSAGEVLWHGKSLNGQIPNVAIVFQSFALFPWLTVLENVEAPLEAIGMRATERHKRALRMLDTVGLDGFERSLPFAADESAVTLADTASLVGRFDVVNIKLNKCGGLTEGLAIAREARRLGLDVMVGNMMGSSLSMAPSYVVGQLCDIVDLDGPIFLARDREPGVRYAGGMIHCPQEIWGGG